jgi:putative molybdopterin biosynthesis protein
VDVAFSMLRDKDTAFLGRTINVGSTGGFHAVKRGEADFAGVHLLDEKTGEYNTPFIRLFRLTESAILVRGYNREQGLIVKPGNPKGIQSIRDITREGVRFVNRNKGSGTRLLIDKHLREIAKSGNIDTLTSTIDGYGYEVKSHSAVAAAIKNDRADAGYGIRTAAALAGLDFIKTDDEKYDFLIPKPRVAKPSVRAFVDLLKSAEFAENLLRRAPGLKTTSETGIIVPIS